MIKVGRLPGCSTVAGLAGLRKIGSRVVRVGGFLVIAQMATHTIGGRALELVANVAGSAFERGMHPGESEARVLQVVEFHPEPVVEIVALITCG